MTDSPWVPIREDAKRQLLTAVVQMALSGTVAVGRELWRRWRTRTPSTATTSEKP